MNLVEAGILKHELPETFEIKAIQVAPRHDGYHLPLGLQRFDDNSHERCIDVGIALIEIRGGKGIG